MKILSASLLIFLISMFGYGLYSGYTEYIDGYEYFELSFNQTVGELDIQAVQIGRVSHHSGWEETVNSIAKGLLEACSNCTITSKINLETIPLSLKGVFENTPVDETYISIDTKNHHMADVRIFFRGFEERFSLEDCEATKTQMEGIGKIVLCIPEK